MKRKQTLGGISAIVEMLNLMDPENRKRILDNVSQRDERLAREIENELFAFEDLARLDDDSIQRLLKEIPQPRLTLALRDASQNLKDTIFRNISERAARILQEEIDSQAPQRLSVIRLAQGEIVGIAKSLLAKGKISLKT